MTYDNTFFLLGTLGAEQPLSNNNATAPSSVEDIVRDTRLAAGYLKRYRPAKPLLHWQFHYSWLPGKRRDVYDGGMAHDDLLALYNADAEMSFFEPDDQGSWNTYFVRFVAGSWQQKVIYRNGDYYAWDVGFELVQSQAGPLSMNYSAVILRETGLLRYYRLGEASGTIAADSSTFAQGGTYSGTVGYSAASLLSGDPNTSITFDGSTTKVTAPAVNLSGSGITLEAWFRSTSIATTQNICNVFSANVAGQTFKFNVVASVLKLNDGSGGAFNGATTLLSNTIYYAVATLDAAGNMKIYLNGVLDGSYSGTGLNVNNMSVNIGNTGTTWFTGRIDEVAVYSRVLSQNDILRHYTAAPVNLVGV